ncbi:hypothetical protein GGQ92_001501 [Gracilibacillus halotolerans]|uniref:RsgI N-terminal anti-sigma domain-containing protein n=1 Tax=Gracilibacillus halotolerans TaxID=74386 RepID=A0A841RNG5_9BACI|nr:hypothetical protein [Gracilibacillus halotolerans]MBB6512715.1 hypothetical protein [Gracilibacillus halotolerans]
MKKGLIVEHRRRYTIVLAKDGVFYKAKPIHEKQIGEDVLFEEITKRKKALIRLPKIAMIPVIALLILMISPLYLWLANDKVYAVISIDINPSLNVTVDKNYQVLEIKANNEDGQQVLHDLELEEKSLEEITTSILMYAKTNFRVEEDAPILVAVSYTDVENESDPVTNVLNERIEELGFRGTVYQAAEEWRIKAEEQEVSMNIIAHETLAEISDTQEEDLTVDEMNQALITQFFNNKEDSSNSVEENKESNVEMPKEDNASEEQKSHGNKEKKELPEQANDRAKERVENRNSSKNEGKALNKPDNNKKSPPGLENKQPNGSNGPPGWVESQIEGDEGPKEPDEAISEKEEVHEESEQIDKNGLDD